MGAGVDPGRPRRFVETARAIAFLDSIASFRPMVRLFGGEPLLHPEWRRILDAAVARGLPVTLVTNGTLLGGLADDLVRSGILAVGISIDPPNANDRHRGEGVFAACADAVAALAAARERHGTAAPAIEIYTTVHGESYSARRRVTGAVWRSGPGTVQLGNVISRDRPRGGTSTRRTAGMEEP